MPTQNQLDDLDMPPATLERELHITVDSPIGGVDPLLAALSESLPLHQGPYDCCLLVRRNCQQRFRALEGSHDGNEGTVQQTDAAQIEFSIPVDHALLQTAFTVIFSAHVNEEPTIRVAEVWGSRSKLLDRDNPNLYWNRPDASSIHGKPVTKK